MQQSQQPQESQESQEPHLQKNYAEGFKRILAAMYAHMSNDVVAATMGHLLLSQNGSRFTFSHIFSLLPTAHLIAWFNDEPLHFKLKTLRKKQSDDYVDKRYAEYFIDHYVYRPLELDGLSCYEFLMHFDIREGSKHQMKRADDLRDANMYRFQSEHPGYKIFVVARRKTIQIPQITSSKSFPNVKLLQIGAKHDDVISNETLSHRETYAQLALLLFSPYRTRTDILKNGSFWLKYVSLNKKGLFPELGKDILQNIQDVEHNCVRDSKKCIDPLMSSTTYKKSDEDKKMNNSNNNNDDDYLDFDALEEAFKTMTPDLGYEPNKVQRNLSYTINRHDVNPEKIDTDFKCDEMNDILNPPNDVLASFSNTNVRSQRTEWNETLFRNDDPLIIEYIAYGCLAFNLYDEENEDPRVDGVTYDKSLNMGQYAMTQTLDLIQTAAFEVMVSSFILLQLEKHDITDAGIARLFPDNVDLQASKQQKRKHLIDWLVKTGGVNDLFMFLSGMGGSGKSRVINAFKQYAQKLCSCLNWHYDFHTVKITAMTGSAATLLPDGRTVHSAAHLNKSDKNIGDDERMEWMNTRTLVIDEVSFMSMGTLDALDHKLKLLTQSDERFGGVQVIIVGDFHQLNPVGSPTPLYRGANVLMQALNRAVFLNKSHRFKHDQRFGQVMRRWRNGQTTPDDLKWINERFIGEADVELPPLESIRYACAENVHRNAISNALFIKHLQNTHNKGCDDTIVCPSHTCIIKGTMKKSKKASHMLASSLCDLIYDTVGDADMKNGPTRKVDPALKFYHNKPLMITCNDDIENDLANGTPCRGLYIKLVDGKQFKKECWEGYMVNTIYAHEVEYMICRHEKDDEDNKKEKPIYFKLDPQSDSVKVNMPTMNNFKFGGINVTQFRVNDNIATTCHKLQGVSLKRLVIDKFNYSLENWIYVVLSRVTTRDGLVLCEKLDESKTYKANEKLLQWEEEIRQNLEESLFKLRGQYEEYQSELQNIDDT